MTIETARLIEVFSSIQGEGPYVGIRQVFVRFFGCNIRCIYCDTPEAYKNPAECLVETHPGSREFEKIPNPVAVGNLESVLSRFARVPHHSVSLTGGEPLIHASFLKNFLPGLHALGLKSYLETNGILTNQLATVLEWIDIISMDIKLPSTLEPCHDYFDEHEEFLRLAAKKDVLVKLVVTSDTPEVDVIRAAELVASVNSSVPLVLQPVTPEGKTTESPTPEHMLHLLTLVSGIHGNVRVIPQVHRLIGQL